MLSSFKRKQCGLGDLVALLGGDPWLPAVRECALAGISYSESSVLLCLAVELRYGSPVLKSTGAELKVHPSGVGTSASESLTTSSPSSWPRHPITPPNVGFLLPHKRALSQDPCHREPERLRKASVRNSICSVSGTVPYSLMWAPRSFFPRPTGRGHLPCTFKSYFLMNLTHLVCSPAV